ncbi:hypothetical protein BT67DRAFT_378428 [Trichocladium antarcticum]|uniref:Uncharacterized protein n=1 Tax=Trichocladium antarcticum TaxID=1450529 RepID=A0AAN6ZEZ6_9PEZI|nr:hypothetical protein BT67DRAFT_378428 [Trichocladium antarcticum]
MPSQFIAARSSRHRRACFALYKSLLLQIPHVALPADVATTLGPTNPLKTLIRNAFRRNRRYNSPRLIVSALKNGYRALTLLSRAADPSTAEHASVLSFLRTNQVRVQGVLARRAAEAAQEQQMSTAPREDRVRLLTRVSPAGALPVVYEPTRPPRPLAEIPAGVRRPPTLCDTLGVPFLRLRKPQPRFLERVLRQKAQFRANAVERIGELQDGDLWQARMEDVWERAVARLVASERGGEVEDREPATYEKTMKTVIAHYGRRLDVEKEDMIARAKAMWDIVLAEKALALEEEKERMAREGREGEEVKPKVWRRPVWDKRGSRALAKEPDDKVQ